MLDSVRSEHLVRLDRTDRRTGDVVVIRGEKAGVLGSFPTDQSGSRFRACLSDSPHNVSDSFGNDLAARDVVGHEQRLCTNDDDVVDDHSDEVLPDGVVNIKRLRDGDLGTDSIGRRRENGATVVLEETGIHQSGESADTAQNR